MVSLIKFMARFEDCEGSEDVFGTFFLTALKNLRLSSRSASTDEECLTFFGFGSLGLLMKSFTNVSEASLEIKNQDCKRI